MLQLAALGRLPDTCSGLGEDAQATTGNLCVTRRVIDDYSSNGGYPADFSEAFAYHGLDGNTTLDRQARWYIREVPPSEQSTCTENYLGNTPDESGRCQNFYEVNAEAFRDGASNSTVCGPDILCLRSTVRVAN